VGVYLAFSLSQLGMVKFWVTKRLPGWQFRVCINALGCLATFTALFVIIEGKFLEGAWMTVVLIGLAPCVFYLIRRHYQTVDCALSVTEDEAK
ncbi:hypothetical protein ABTM54_19165, partial [Acinetobacter baumannii]